MAESYRVEVTMDGGPFHFDNSEPTILKRDELEKMIERFGGRVKVDEKTEAKPRARAVPGRPTARPVRGDEKTEAKPRASAGVLLRALPAKPKD